MSKGLLFDMSGMVTDSYASRVGSPAEGAGCLLSGKGSYVWIVAVGLVFWDRPGNQEVGMLCP